MKYSIRTFWNNGEDIRKCADGEQPTMAKALAYASRDIAGRDHMEAVIRYVKGKQLAALLTTNWRGEITEVEIHSPVSSLVTPMNPRYFDRLGREVHPCEAD
jgi:hypothetical protein